MIGITHTFGNTREEQILEKVADELRVYGGPGRDRWVAGRRRVLTALLAASAAVERPAILRELTRLEAGQ